MKPVPTDVELYEEIKKGLGNEEARVLIGFMNHRFENVSLRFEEVNRRIDQRFEEVNHRFEEVNRRFDQKFEEVNHRFEEVNRRFDQKLEEVNQKIDHKIEEVNRKLDLKFEQAESKTDQLSKEMNFRFNEIMLKLIQIETRHTESKTHIQWIYGLIASIVILMFGQYLKK